MDFTFTHEQRMMAAAFRELTADICAPERIRALFEAPGAGAAVCSQEDLTEMEGRWRRLAEMGLPGVLAPESAGGMGLQDADFVLIAEEAGRAALPEALVDHAGVAVPLLAELAGHERVARLLPQATNGEARVMVAHQRNPFVAGAAEATHWLVCEDEAIHLLEKSQVRLTPQASIDVPRRPCSVEAGTSADTIVASAVTAKRAAARALQRGALYTAAQCVGLAERLIDIAVTYARERVQFGKPIGSYQAIKHQLANVQVKLEFARPVVHAAAARLTDLDARALAAVSHAKLAGTDAADLAARTAIQVHGAMGYSWEVNLHFYMKRAWALAGVWGDRSFHARRVQGLLDAGALALGPAQTFERGQEIQPGCGGVPI
jgi:alkylation response protein AidB-like acyl-CoA dehydrogenase